MNSSADWFGFQYEIMSCLYKSWVDLIMSGIHIYVYLVIFLQWIMRPYFTSKSLLELLKHDKSISSEYYHSK